MGVAGRKCVGLDYIQLPKFFAEVTHNNVFKYSLCQPYSETRAHRIPAKPDFKFITLPTFHISNRRKVMWRTFNQTPLLKNVISDLLLSC